MQGSLFQLHFNLTGGSFPNISVSTGIHTHTHATLATKECGTLLGRAGGGKLALSVLEIPLNEGVIAQKPAMLVLSGCQPHHPPATTTDSPGAAKGMKRLLAHAENPKPCSEKHLMGLLQGSNCTLTVVLWVTGMRMGHRK